MKRLYVLCTLLLTLAGGTFLAQTGQWHVLMYPDPEPGVASTWCFGINEAAWRRTQ